MMWNQSDVYSYQKPKSLSEMFTAVVARKSEFGSFRAVFSLAAHKEHLSMSPVRLIKLHPPHWHRLFIVADTHWDKFKKLCVCVYLCMCGWVNLCVWVPVCVIKMVQQAKVILRKTLGDVSMPRCLRLASIGLIREIIVCYLTAVAKHKEMKVQARIRWLSNWPQPQK